MKKLQIILLCFLLASQMHGQSSTRKYVDLVVEITKEKKPKRIYTKVQSLTAFAGGDSVWIKLFENSLNQNLVYKNKAKAGKYIVQVKFLIEKNGSVFDVVCIKDPGFGMCKQVMNAVLKSFPHRWKAGEPGNISVSTTPKILKSL